MPIATGLLLARVNFAPELALAGSVLAAGAGGWYVCTILRRQTRPHRTTWGVWTLIGVLGSGSALQAGAGAGASVAMIYLALHVVVFALSLSSRFGKPGGEWYDRPLGLAAVGAIVLWQVMDLPAAVAATIAVAADGLALWPTLRESWRQPHTESLSAWLVDGMAATLGALAVPDLEYARVAYPAYLAVGNSAVAGALLLRWMETRTALR
jgi:predicted permease